MLKNKLILAVILILSFSLVGCSNKTPSENTETTSTEETESTESTQIEEKDKSYEFIAVIDRIDEKGITMYPYEDTSDLLDIDDSFYVSRNDISITKNGKSSIYDIVYFYDGIVVKFEGTFEKKSSHTIMHPSDGTKIAVELLDEYKEISNNSNDDRDETPIDIIDDDSMKADVEYNGVFTKFSIPGKYATDITFVTDTNLSSNPLKVDIYYSIIDNGKERKIRLLTVDRLTKEGKKGSRYGTEVNYTEGFVITEDSTYAYEIRVNTGVDYVDIKEDIINKIINTIIIIE